MMFDGKSKGITYSWKARQKFNASKVVWKQPLATLICRFYKGVKILYIEGCTVNSLNYIWEPVWAIKTAHFVFYLEYVCSSLLTFLAPLEKVWFFFCNTRDVFWDLEIVSVSVRALLCVKKQELKNKRTMWLLAVRKYPHLVLLIGLSAPLHTFKRIMWKPEFFHLLWLEEVHGWFLD